jgi:hypothetical protein
MTVSGTGHTVMLLHVGTLLRHDPATYGFVIEDLGH